MTGVKYDKTRYHRMHDWFMCLYCSCSVFFILMKCVSCFREYHLRKFLHSAYFDLHKYASASESYPMRAAPCSHMDLPFMETLELSRVSLPPLLDTQVKECLIHKLILIARCQEIASNSS